MVATPASRASIRNTNIALIVITTVTVASQLIFTVIQQKQLRLEDGWVALCYIFFLVLAILYLNIVPAFFRLSDLQEGLIRPYETSTEDALFIQKALFASTICFWLCLWSAKFSLLSMYKNLVVKFSFYLKLWYALVWLCILLLIVSIVAFILACSSLDDWFAIGKCTTPRDVVATAISMWYSYAADVLTNLLIMLLPLRLILTLQMPLSRKCSIVGLFCLGLFCIIAATIRVTQINNPGGLPKVPWLALWCTVEAGIAVIIAAGPGLYRSVKLYSRSRKQYYAENSRTHRSQGVRELATYRDGTELRPYSHPTVTLCCRTLAPQRYAMDIAALLIQAQEEFSQSLSFVNITQKRHCGKTLLHKIRTFSDKLSPYFKIIDIFCSTHPEWANIAWGALRLILQLASNFGTFFEKLCEHLGYLSDVIPRFHEVYASLNGDSGSPAKFSPRLPEALVRFYQCLFDFFHAVARVFTKKDGSLKKTPVYVMSILIQPFESRFHDILQRMRACQDVVQKELELALLSSIQLGEVKTSSLQKDLDNIYQQVFELNSNIPEMQQDHLSQRILEWISPPLYKSPFEKAKNNQEPETAEWLLDEPEFQA
ncbi:hypothetical protein NM208_g7314 [Fusarium decemcellulare]|uniref:Uncharacterized protein n=1 Tax=Fusarium decemcellulare TaxID=57161 RepID=A0ACC1S9K7_9HYPO|nr:hypothetical protein NM208_g7314 [Fusarium decemcellulare]